MRNFNTLLFVNEAFDSLWSIGDSPQATINIAGTDVKFYHQHDPTVLPNGDILLLDNGESDSRVIQFRVDPANKSAKLVKEFRPDPPIYASARGSVSRLLNGNTLVGFSNIIVGPPAPLITEFDEVGNQVGKMTLPIKRFWDGYRIIPMEVIGQESYIGNSIPPAMP